MKTPLGPNSQDLEAALGTETSQDRFISVQPIVANGGCNKLNSYKMCAEDKMLVEIERALKRLQNDTYGICIMCGGTISIERLDRNPAVEDCAECAANMAPKVRSAPA